FRTPWTYRNTAPVAPMASRKATIIAKPLVFMSSPLVVSVERGSTLQDDRFDPELLAVLADGAGLERETDPHAVQAICVGVLGPGTVDQIPLGVVSPPYVHDLHLDESDDVEEVRRRRRRGRDPPFL